MIISLSTLLSRARRRAQAAPFFSITSLPVIEGVAQVLRRDRRAALVIEMDGIGSVSAASLTRYIYETVHDAEGEAAVVHRVDPGMVSQAVAAGATTLWLTHPHSMSDSDYAQACRAAATLGHGHGCAIIAESRTFVLPSEPEALVRSCHAAALAVSVEAMRDGEPVLDPHALHAAARSAGVPLIGREMPQEARQRHMCVKAGVNGWQLPADVLNEPYTAGLYTGLRDRSQTDPAVYTKYGRKAVAEAAARLMQ